MPVNGRYTKSEIEEARQKMLEHLATIGGGQMILGCCTQSCCVEDAQEFFVPLSRDTASGSGSKD